MKVNTIVNYLIIAVCVLISTSYSKENQLFWDGHDWNRISKKSKNDPSNSFRIKTAYLHGALDGRLNSYLKVIFYQTK